MKDVLSQGTVDKISFDFGLEILVSGDLVRIEAPGKVGSTVTQASSFDPESIGEMALPLLALLHKSVAVTIGEGSSLQIKEVESATFITVESSDFDEAWSVTLADGSRFVASAGGTVAHWPA